MAQKTKLCKISDARHIFITPPVVISFPKLFKPVMNGLSGKEEFSADFIFQDEEDLKQAYKGKKKQTVSCMRAVVNARADQWGDKENWPKWSFKTIKDGDKNINKKENEPYAGYEGKKYITAKSGAEYPPKIVGSDGHPLDPKDMYGGCVVRALLIARPVEFGKTVGVRFILSQVMKVEDGERFGGGGHADVFDVQETSGDDDNWGGGEDGSDEDGGDEENF